MYITSFERIDSWPRFIKPLASLKTLTWWSISEANVLCNVELHQSLPNLESLLFGIRNCPTPFILPDMRGCKKLKDLYLCRGIVSVARLPRTLESLLGDATIVNLDKATLKRTHRRLQFIDQKIKFIATDHHLSIDNVPQRDQEQQHNRETQKCCVCLDRPPQVVLVPCGHMNICAPCAHEWKEKPRHEGRRSLPKLQKTY